MSWVVGAIPGAVAAFVVVLFLRGYHMLRSDPDVGLEADDLLYLSRSERAQSGGQSALGRAATALSRRLRRVLPAGAVARLQRHIDMAGRPDGLDVDAVLVQCFRWLLIVTPVIVLGVFQLAVHLIVLPVVLAVVMPLANLSGMGRKRRERIDADLPDFLDVLAVTVSAGLGFRRALETVAERFGGPLSEEVTIVLQQIANGASVRSAFRNMRRRTHSEAVDEFVTAYLQAEELGAPLVDTLNQIATDMRRASAQRLRQRAAQVEPRISLVLTLVLIPGAMIILAGGMLLALGGTRGLGAILGGG